jgi:hypothetical protein
MLTAEIRWFSDHARAFKSLEQLLPFSRPSERTDHYLLGSGTRVGIKWREGNIEVKQQQGEGQTYQKDTVSGTIENWKKWSFALENQNDYLDKFDTQYWLPVSKQRRLAPLKYDEVQHNVLPLSSDQQAENRCEVEITQVLADGDLYFTLGLEASGRRDKLQESLVATIDYILERSALEELDMSLGRSSNYARWIQTTFNDRLSG